MIKEYILMCNINFADMLYLPKEYLLACLVTWKNKGVVTGMKPFHVMEKFYCVSYIGWHRQDILLMVLTWSSSVLRYLNQIHIYDAVLPFGQFSELWKIKQVYFQQVILMRQTRLCKRNRVWIKKRQLPQAEWLWWYISASLCTACVYRCCLNWSNCLSCCTHG